MEIFVGREVARRQKAKLLRSQTGSAAPKITRVDFSGGAVTLLQFSSRKTQVFQHPRNFDSASDLETASVPGSRTAGRRRERSRKELKPRQVTEDPGPLKRHSAAADTGTFRQMRT
ncbi:hypothetical protein STEG23_019641 [Scotinomys teguina]